MHEPRRPRARCIEIAASAEKRRFRCAKRNPGSTGARSTQRTLRLDLIWTEMEERDSQILVRALATLDRRIALGEQLMVGFCNSGKAQSARKLWRVTRN